MSGPISVDAFACAPGSLVIARIARCRYRDSELLDQRSVHRGADVALRNWSEAATADTHSHRTANYGIRAKKTRVTISRVGTMVASVETLRGRNHRHLRISLSGVGLALLGRITWKT